MQDDLRTIPLGNGFDDRQPQATARHVDVLTTVEAVKYTDTIGGRNPRSRVDDFDLNGVWRTRDLHVHRPPRWRVADGILQEVPEQNAQTVRIAYYTGRVIPYEPEINAFLGCEWRMVRDDRVEEGIQGHQDAWPLGSLWLQVGQRQ